MEPSLSRLWTSFRPPKSHFTEENIPDLQGKVSIVLGSNTGIGKEVARILYARNTKVYVSARSEEKANIAIADIQKTTAASKGAPIFLHLDLSDLNQVKEAAQNFLAEESNLHALFNNAGLIPAPVEPPPKTVQGYELALVVNCIGTFLFTRLLTPVLVPTAN